MKPPPPAIPFEVPVSIDDPTAVLKPPNNPNPHHAFAPSLRADAPMVTPPAAHQVDPALESLLHASEIKFTQSGIEVVDGSASSSRLPLPPSAVLRSISLPVLSLPATTDASSSSAYKASSSPVAPLRLPIVYNTVHDGTDPVPIAASRPAPAPSTPPRLSLGDNSTHSSLTSSLKTPAMRLPIVYLDPPVDPLAPRPLQHSANQDNASSANGTDSPSSSRLNVASDPVTGPSHRRDKLVIVPAVAAPPAAAREEHRTGQVSEQTVEEKNSKSLETSAKIHPTLTAKYVPIVEGDVRPVKRYVRLVRRVVKTDIALSYRTAHQ